MPFVPTATVCPSARPADLPPRRAASLGPTANNPAPCSNPHGRGLAVGRTPKSPTTYDPVCTKLRYYACRVLLDA